MSKRTSPKGRVQVQSAPVPSLKKSAGPDVKSGPLPTLPVWEGWSKAKSYLLLAAATVACLLPFSGRAFHVDDTLFMFAAQQIAQHPLDPYGFQVLWNTVPEPMSDVTQNPPLTSYYIALVGKVAGWSEISLHLAFLLPAIAVTLGTYRLAGRFTRLPWLAALLGLLTPAALICASSVMCDTLMLAFSVWAMIFWIEGLEKKKTWLFVVAGLLLAASALTKYFAVAFLPLLLVYSLLRERRLGTWIFYLLIPVAALFGYEMWTEALYGHGLISNAASYATTIRTNKTATAFARIWGAVSFLGGCFLPALMFVPMLWRRRTILIAGLFALANGFGMGWFNFGMNPDNESHWILVSLQLVLTIGAGLSALGLTIQDWRTRRDADSTFLLLWVFGTFLFAGFVNWTTNVRSILPVIPAAAILLSRRLETTISIWDRKRSLWVAVALAVSAVPALWVAAGDAALANAGRQAAILIKQKAGQSGANLWFEGHWGFQYYMQSLGAAPVDPDRTRLSGGDYLVIAENNTEQINEPDPAAVSDHEEIEIPMPLYATTISHALGAACYSSHWGPLPFAFGPVDPEKYQLFHLASTRANPAPSN